MKWQFMISLKYLLERRRERFISVTTVISVLGIAVGVAALIVTIGVMNGFNNEIEEKILSVNPHIIIGSEVPIEDSRSVIDTVMGISGILGSEEFLDGQALINVNDKVMGVLLRGVHPDPEMRLTKMENYIASGSLELRGRDAIVGSEFARNFGVKRGDKVSIIAPLSSRAREFRVNGIFNSGRYDYDLNMVFINREEAGALLGKENVVSAIGLKVDDVFNVDAIKRKIQSLIRPPFWTMTWKDIDKNLFSALKLEKIVMFILMTLIVCVACFNVISTLIMTVMEKTKDIGILKAIGVNRRGIMSVFLLQGLYISIIGIILGASLGLGLCYLQSEYELVKLPPDVYYIYSVPIQVRMPDTVIIIAAAFVLGLIATVYPSLHAARLNPVEVLKYE